MTVVDVHAHVIVPGLGAETEWVDGQQVVRLDGREIRSAVREFVDVGRILEEQDAAGVDRVLLCPWVNLCGRETGRQNEALAALVGPRVACLGTVDPEQPDELLQVMADGRLSGVEVPASVRSRYLGHEALRDFWAAAEETGAIVFVHPTTKGFTDPVFDEHYLWNTVGNPLETTVTAAQLVMSGVLDEHPRLRVVLAHGGGAILSLRGRLAHEQSFHAPGRDVRAALRRFHYDTVVHDEDVLRELVDFAGADRVLCGSDYPFDMGAERPAGIVRALGLPAEEEAAILGGNALRLLGQEDRS
ncbi:MAG TPA: amidohydrolase family protein [Gaiellaceae bacterium]|jgi:aminocarboxymuconate-semialdehyde decarboxylase|nr:amidohydrolase family protein [Gaiellaceae bacterium]